jgi:hypothetical protein
MRIALLLALVAGSAHADLYRWVDPASGSVKFSSLPPSDPRVEPGVVRYNAPALPPKPVAVAPAASGPTAELESKWRTLLTELIGSLKRGDLAKGSDDLRQHLQAYEAVRSQLDRLDPAGAARRAAEAAVLVERLKQGATAAR